MFLLLGMFATISWQQKAAAQDDKNDKETIVKNLVDSKNFVFVPTTVSPLRGGSRPITSDFDMRLYGDSVISYLPYFGRAYTAPIDPSEGGVNFTSKDFEYAASHSKKGWNILIKPHDVKEVQELHLSVTTKGYATLQVTSFNRDAISYNGYIRERKYR